VELGLSSRPIELPALDDFSLDAVPPRMAAALPQRAAKAQSRPADAGDRLPPPGSPTRRARQGDASQAEDVGEDVPDDRPGRPDPGLSLKPGARLVREWHGRTHTVTVTEDGFEYGGMSYSSLTKVARKITDAHWSGPRFFGLVRAGARTSGSDDNG
jgi:hypothetical protein